MSLNSVYGFRNITNIIQRDKRELNWSLMKWRRIYSNKEYCENKFNLVWGEKWELEVHSKTKRIYVDAMNKKKNYTKQLFMSWAFIKWSSKRRGKQIARHDMSTSKYVYIYSTSPKTIHYLSFAPQASSASSTRHCPNL